MVSEFGATIDFQQHSKLINALSEGPIGFIISKITNENGEKHSDFTQEALKWLRF